MTLPRALFLLALGLGVVGLVLLFSHEEPVPRPGDEVGGGHAAPAPDPLAGEASPGALPTETPSARPGDPKPAAPKAAVPKAAPSKVKPPEPPEAREARPLRVVSEAGGEPIVGAEVAVLDDLPDLRPGRRRPAERAPRSTGVTGTDGSYVVAADAPRAGAVRVHAKGFVDAIVALTPFPTEIRLARARSLRVRVIDDHGRPLEGATVRAVGSLRDVEARTGPDGRAEIAADGTDWRRLEAFAEGFVVALRDLTIAGAPREESITIVLDGGGPTILGRVVADEDGSPIGGATIDLVSGAVERGVFATTTSASDGTFTLRVGVPDGLGSTVQASAPGRLRAVLSPNLGGSSFTPLETPPPSSTAPPPPREIRLERGRAVEGVVKGASGVPVAGARVHALSIAGLTVPGREGEGPSQATTDAEGRFQIRVPKVGSEASWHVVAHGPQGDWGSLPLGRVASDAPIVIVLEGLGSIEGRVVSSDGAGIAGVRVRPSQTAALDWLVGSSVGGVGSPTVDGGSPRSPAAGSTDSALTNADGHFRLGPLPAGTLELSLERDGRPLGRSASVRVVAGQTVTIDPIPLGSGEIAGVVLDLQGREAAGIFVRLGPAAAQGIWGLSSVLRDTRTDSLGRFRFSMVDPSERVSLQASTATGEGVLLEGVLPRAEPYELQLTALPRLVLRVTRAGQLYDGPLQVSFHASLPPARSSRGSETSVFMNPTWMSCVVGQVSIPVRVVAPYAVEVRSAEAEPASASGVSEVDPADRNATRVTLDLRVPEPAAPEGGMAAGR